MTTWRINCHNADERGNEVLRAAVLWSGQDRRAASGNYYIVRVGVGSGDKVDWLGEWDGGTDSLAASEARDLLDPKQPGTRLAAGAPLLIEVERVGRPVVTTSGLTVELRLERVAGNSQGDRPLFHSGGFVGDEALRGAIAALERQLNTSGVATRTIPVPLSDPADAAEVGNAEDAVFQGRMQRDSATQISLQRYTGDYCVVNGSMVQIGSSGLTCTTSDLLLAATGLSTGAAPAASATLYYAYLVGLEGSYSPGKLRLSATAPSMTENGYYLGTSGNALNCRFVGYVRTNATPNFVNDTTDRWVINYYNRLALPIILKPGYSDDNAETTYTTTSTTWVTANGGTGATGSYVANGEDAVEIDLFAQMSSTAGNGPFAGIGDNSTTAAVVDCTASSTVAFTGSCHYRSIPAAGYRTVSVLIRCTGGTSTFRADNVRGGGAADPIATGIVATVMG